MYEHKFLDGSKCNLKAQKIICLGWNYTEHMEEVGDSIKKPPVVFMKPLDALVSIEKPIKLPDTNYNCEYETEVAILVGKKIRKENNESIIKSSILGLGIGIDLTLRKLQKELQSNEAPWELSKSFRGSLVLSPFIEINKFSNLNNIEFTMKLNSKTKQHGQTKLMRYNIIETLAYISQHFTIEAGDVIITGSPKGTEDLKPNDKIDINFNNFANFSTTVSEEKI